MDEMKRGDTSWYFTHKTDFDLMTPEYQFERKNTFWHTQHGLEDGV